MAPAYTTSTRVARPPAANSTFTPKFGMPTYARTIAPVGIRFAARAAPALVSTAIDPDMKAPAPPYEL